MRESMHVFIQAGLSEAEKLFEKIYLLEIGLGTGLNCLLTYFNHQKPVWYMGVEAFPVEESILGKLNYHEWLHYRDAPRLFRTIHACRWNEPVALSADFQLVKYQDDVTQLRADMFQPHAVNLIYFDAFGPGAQPEMWTQDIMDKMYALLVSQGILVTYCAKGEVRRRLKAAGFLVESLPGPKGKREMTRAVKP